MTKAILAGLVSCILAHAAVAQGMAVPPGSGTPESPYLISSLEHLVWMGATVADSAGRYYKLVNDIDASATAGWNDPGTGAGVKEGFKPIGYLGMPFCGYFDGQKHEIRNLTINRKSAECVGLFGFVSGRGIIQRVGVRGGSVVGQDFVGGLVGRNQGCLIEEAYSSLSVSGRLNSAGGLVGYNYNSTIRDCFSRGATRSGTGWRVGGLVGYNRQSSIFDCYASGLVSGGQKVGGLVGYNKDGSIDRCYTRGKLSGVIEVGGFVGRNEGYNKKSTIVGSGFIRNSYSTRSVNGGADVGGFSGYNLSGAIWACYAAGPVKAIVTNRVAGFAARNDLGLILDCFWDTQSSGQPDPGASFGEGVPTVEMNARTLYENWNFTSTWDVSAATNGGYPFLRSMPMVQFSPAARNVGEGNKTVRLRVARYGNTDTPLTMKYVTKGKSAVAGQDFVAAAGLLTWAAGDAAPKYIPLQILDDSVTEPDEFLLVKVGRINGADCLAGCTVKIKGNVR